MMLEILAISGSANMAFGWSGGLIAICGILMIVLGVDNWRRSLKSNKWPTTNATVTSSNVSPVLVFPVLFWLWTYRASITYKYSINGKQYRSTGIANGGGIFMRKGEAQMLVAEYPAGREVTVHFNPKQPRDAVLLPGTNRVGYLSFTVLTGLGVLLVLIGIIIWTASN